MKVMSVCTPALAAMVTMGAAPAFSADLIEGYRPKVEYAVRHDRPRHVVRTAYIDRGRLECAELIVEYRYIPRKDYLRVCNPPVF